jgi:hypothetical protein
MASPLLMAAALLIRVAAITLVREGAMIDVCLETYCPARRRRFINGLKMPFPAVYVWVLVFVGRAAKTSDGERRESWVFSAARSSEEVFTPHETTRYEHAQPQTRTKDVLQWLGRKCCGETLHRQARVA